MKLPSDRLALSCTVLSTFCSTRYQLPGHAQSLTCSAIRLPADSCDHANIAEHRRWVFCLEAKILLLRSCSCGGKENGQQLKVGWFSLCFRMAVPKITVKGFDGLGCLAARVPQGGRPSWGFWVGRLLLEAPGGRSSVQISTERSTPWPNIHSLYRQSPSKTLSPNSCTQLPMNIIVISW